MGDVSRFASEAWGRCAWRHRTGLDAAALDSLLDLPAIERFLDATARTPFVRLVRADRPVATSSYVVPTRVAGELLDDVVDPAAVHREFADGATIVLQGLQRAWHPLVDAALTLERELGHPVQVNAYLTPPDAQGLGRHADRHDVFVLQLSGSKRWWVAGLGELTLEPGDALYVPLGTQHDARTGPRHSLHLTIGVPRITYRDVLRRWLDTARCDALDDPLPIGHHRDGGAMGIEPLAERLYALAAEARAAAADERRLTAVVEREAIRQRERRRPLLDGRLASAADAPPDADTPLRRPDGLHVTLDPGPDADGRCVVRAGATTLRMPWRVRGAMEAVLDAEVVRACDLTSLDAGSAVVLVRRLVREGVLVRA